MFSTVAIAYTLGSVTVPSLASVYNEFALKKHMDTSVHEQNFFLYFYGALFNLLGVLATMAFGGLSWSAIFHGHSKVSRSNQTISAILQELNAETLGQAGVSPVLHPTRAAPMQD